MAESKTRRIPFASYSTNIATELTVQLKRFRSLNPFQLAGHVANMEFWSNEVAHCVDVLDRYNERFGKLAAAQKQYVTGHQTTSFELRDQWGDTANPPANPKRVPHRERSEARRELCDAYYRFLVRCHTVKLISKETLRSECGRHAISIDPMDL